MESFKTIATFTNPSEHLVIANLLEAEGIRYFLKDENTVQVYNLYSNAIGGVKLQVYKEDADRALEIIESNSIPNEPTETTTHKKISSSSSKICPTCSSTNISKAKFSRQSLALSILFLGFPLPFLAREAFCFDCSKYFKVK